jgi:Metallo-peptidase family M12
MNRFKILVIVICTIGLVFGLAFAGLNSGKEGPNNELFFDANLSTDAFNMKQVQEKQDPTLVQSRYVYVNFDYLNKADSIVLNLFQNISVKAVRDRLERRFETRYSWFGRVDGIEQSSVILTIEDGTMAGNITIDGKFYQVRPSGDGIHSIREIDQSAFPGEDCAPPIEEPGTESLEPQLVLPTSEYDDNGSTIDVMVVYTQDAANASFNITAEIQLAVDETNQSYINSLVNPRIRLVHAAQVTYTETGNISTDVSRLKNPSDGYMDEVHTWRNQYNADMVTLIVENGGAYCGIAYAIMSTVSPSFEDKAFNVTDRGCATGYYSFGHELGHLQGARHDWYVDPTNNSPYTYNHGYVSPNNDWRTVMAYSNACFGCTRIQYWSNPNVQYGGLPMGVPEGQFQAADNRKTLNNTAYTVANFRQGGVVSFIDVPSGYWAEQAIYKIYNAGITTGCSQNPLRYCPEDPTNRAQMAVFLGRAVHGSSFTPPSPTGIFNDVPVSYWSADWIEQFYNDGITSGCNTNPLRYCPTNSVTRAQMAIFLLRAKHGSSYTPPPATGIFNDVSTGYWAAAWIEQLYNEGITTGCGTSPLRYCPENTVTRAQMAVFIVRTFGL